MGSGVDVDGAGVVEIQRKSKSSLAPGLCSHVITSSHKTEMWGDAYPSELGNVNTTLVLRAPRLHSLNMILQSLEISL